MEINQGASEGGAISGAVQIKNTIDEVINPATSEKQDEAIGVLQEIKTAIQDEGIYTVRIDEASSTITYIGKSYVGVPDSDPVWQIQRLDTSGIALVLKWAESTAGFSYVWNDRATYTYN